MEVQLLVYIRRYSKNFTSDLGRKVFKSSNRYSTGGSFNFLNTTGTLFEKKKCVWNLDLGIILFWKIKKPNLIHLKTAIYSLINQSYIAILVTERLIIYSIIIKKDFLRTGKRVKHMKSSTFALTVDVDDWYQSKTLQLSILCQ